MNKYADGMISPAGQPAATCLKKSVNVSSLLKVTEKYDENSC
jgi:hypothetical protein